jgi:CDP-glycerol glycerophosphotransferase (TagB/SpsB family)
MNILKRFLRYGVDAIIIPYYKLLGLFYKNKSKFKDAWLICERGLEAGDNGYFFFKYMRLNYPDKKVYYLIDTSRIADFNRVKEFGNIIEYNSFEHKMAALYASVFISTHTGYITPWRYLLQKKIFTLKKRLIYVWLSHGVTKEDISDLINKYTTGIDLITCVTEAEKASFLSNKKYGFDRKNVALTGFARFDNLLPFETKNQIIFMPTWRKYLIRKTVYHKAYPDLSATFVDSVYFKQITNFLTNEKLHHLLESNNLTMVFYPHFVVQKSLDLFKINSNRIITANNKNDDIQQVLKEGKMLITDYSGVAFDFAYMYKPLVYYQFDREEYYSHHYRKGYFDMEKDGFGPVVKTGEALISTVESIIKNNFEMDALYRKRVDNTFVYRDNKNCERIYNAIINCKKQ